MSVGLLGEIRMFGGDFAPRNWANCDGLLLPVSMYADLFELLGTTYGGDGVHTFALPDLRGRIPIHAGSGTGLSARALGQQVGEENVTLTTDQIPSHLHSWQAAGVVATGTTPKNAVLANAVSEYCTNDSRKLVEMNSKMIGNSGGQKSHDNRMPSQCIRFIICLVGDKPQQS